MWAAGRSQRPAQTDLRSALEDGDHHHVGDTDASHEKRHGAESEEQGGQGALRVGAGLERA